MTRVFWKGNQVLFRGRGGFVALCLSVGIWSVSEKVLLGYILLALVFQFFWPLLRCEVL
jgi:hypothetical protein